MMVNKGQEISFFNFAKAAMFFIALACSMIAMEDRKMSEQKAQDSYMSLTDRIEFAFVLLPDDSIMKEIQEIAVKVTEKLELLEKNPFNLICGDYLNKVVNLPHVSIGQYGLLGVEYLELTNIVREIAPEFKPFVEPISRGLSVTKENIFLDFQNINAKTNLEIKKLYVELRTQFMNKITTKFPITQALLSRFNNKGNFEELFFIDQCYQNWGTPEQDRIRPHFTLVYNYAYSGDAVEGALVGMAPSSSLETITFDRLGIAQIDAWGNPTKLLYAISLGA